jgi:hypothetical protein
MLVADEHHAVFMLTADEPTTVQTYGHENGEAIFI